MLCPRFDTQGIIITLCGASVGHRFLGRANARPTVAVKTGRNAVAQWLVGQLDLLERICAHTMSGGAALVVLHDLAMAVRFERVLVLDAGELVGDGPPLDVLTPQRLRERWGVAGRLVRGEARVVLALQRRG